MKLPEDVRENSSDGVADMIEADLQRRIERTEERDKAYKYYKKKEREVEGLKADLLIVINEYDPLWDIVLDFLSSTKLSDLLQLIGLPEESERAEDLYRQATSMKEDLTELEFQYMEAKTRWSDLHMKCYREDAKFLKDLIKQSLK